MYQPILVAQPSCREARYTLCKKAISIYNYPPCSAKHYTGDSY
ncbi:hypothetical protein HMPREF3185_00913 [Porphyromonas somerae]|uniref:Uncharacterized protein n=1 Tax=Porphyromonas somerae TaxID=322095 RepID=A0A134B9B1_9PORP|nr:hypothetical protein HMPREF3184_00913 [Porphyromonadaceae bacterium KA00676]KXB76543.1 hypothetical protein HMPREF3185_00913 [Porphyromonas somerae]